MEIVSFVIIVAFIILPVKVAAGYLDANNTSIFMCVVALIMAAAIQKGISLYIPQLTTQYSALDGIISIFISAIAYMIVLGTNYFEGVIIALIQTILTFAMIFLVGLTGLSVAFFHSYYTTNTFDLIPL